MKTFKIDIPDFSLGDLVDDATTIKGSLETDTSNIDVDTSNLKANSAEGSVKPSTTSTNTTTSSNVSDSSSTLKNSNINTDTVKSTATVDGKKGSVGEFNIKTSVIAGASIAAAVGEIVINYTKLSAAIDSLNNIITNGSGHVKKSLLIVESKGMMADTINGGYEDLKITETYINEIIQKTAYALDCALTKFKNSDEKAASHISSINTPLLAGATGIAIGGTYIGADGTVDDYANIKAAKQMEELYENGGRVEVNESAKSNTASAKIGSNEDEATKSSASSHNSKSHSSSSSSSSSSSGSSSSSSSGSASGSSSSHSSSGSSSGGSSTKTTPSSGSSGSSSSGGGYVPELKIVKIDAEYCSKTYAYKRFGQVNGYVIDFATDNGFDGQWSSTVNRNHFDINLMTNNTAISYNTLAVNTTFDPTTGSNVMNVAYIESVNDGFVYYTDSGASTDPSLWGYVKKVSIDNFREMFDYTLSPIKGVTDFVVSTL